MTIQEQNVPSCHPPPFCLKAIPKDAEIVRHEVLRHCQLLWIPAHCLLTKGKSYSVFCREITAPQYQPWGKMQMNTARDVQPLATLSGGLPPCTENAQETGGIYHYSSNSQGNLLGNSSTQKTSVCFLLWACPAGG